MNHRLAVSVRLVWVLALLASLGLLFAAVPGYINELVVANSAAELSLLVLAATFSLVGLCLRPLRRGAA